MISNDQKRATISIVYPVEHIPRGGRVARLSWIREAVGVDLRCCSESELKLAFQIAHVDKDTPTNIYLASEGFWWPVGSGEADLGHLLRNLQDGYRDTIGLVGARIRGSYNCRIEAKIESREVFNSGRDEALGRALLAAQNVLVVDGKRAYVRGSYPLYSFYAEGDRDETCIDVFNSGFEYGRPLPTKLSDARAHYLDEFNLRSFMAHGQVFGAGQSEDDRMGDKLTYLARINCEVPPPPFDLVESQLHLLCRDLFEAVDENRHLPLLVRRNGLTIYRLDSEGRPSSKGCVRAIENLRGWLSDIDPDLRRQFRSATEYLQSRIPEIEITCRRLGRPSPFALEPEDDETIANLPV